MTCHFPLEGYRSREVGPSGKRRIVFNPAEGYTDLRVSVPCGQCGGCRLERSRQWAIRMMHEASLYEENCFITLTYSDQYLPENGSLDRKAFPLFMRRLRKKFHGRTIRYYHCGEYGSKYGRPHYHSCLFGFDFPDKTYWTSRNGIPVFRSDILEKLWWQGNSEVGSLTYESAAYCAHYIEKKVLGTSEASDEMRYQKYGYVDNEGEVFLREPEYSTMSRRPGIGKPWLEKFGCEVYPEDGVVVRGMLQKPPRYYDGLYELTEPEMMDRVRALRRRAADLADHTPEKLAAMKAIFDAKRKLRQTRNRDF